MRRMTLIVIVAASSLLGEQVFMSRAGKTYHAKVECSRLARAKVRFTADKAEAEKHGLTACQSCYRPKDAVVGRSWTKPIK